MRPRHALGFGLALALAASLLVSQRAAAQTRAGDPRADPPENKPGSSGWPDRLYLDFGVGIGLFKGRAGAPADRRSFTGLAVPFQGVIGIRLGQRFVLGAAYIRDDVFRLSSEDEVIDGDEPNLDGTGMTFGLAALTGIWHPLGDDGLNVQAALGVGSFSVVSPGVAGNGYTDVKSSESVVGWALGLGYHRRVAGRFSLGALARLTRTAFDSSGSTGVTDVSVFTPSLLFTVGGH